MAGGDPGERRRLPARSRPPGAARPARRAGGAAQRPRWGPGDPFRAGRSASGTPSRAAVPQGMRRGPPRRRKTPRSRRRSSADRRTARRERCGLRGLRARLLDTRAWRGQYGSPESRYRREARVRRALLASNTVPSLPAPTSSLAGSGETRALQARVESLREGPSQPFRNVPVVVRAMGDGRDVLAVPGVR